MKRVEERREGEGDGGMLAGKEHEEGAGSLSVEGTCVCMAVASAHRDLLSPGEYQAH